MQKYIILALDELVEYIKWKSDSVPRPPCQPPSLYNLRKVHIEEPSRTRLAQIKYCLVQSTKSGTLRMPPEGQMVRC